MVGRELTTTEASATLPEVALKVASWGVKRLSRWVMFSPHPLTIVLPNPECVLLIRDREVHHKIKALTIGLSMYRAEYEVSKFSGSLAEELVKVASNISKDDNHRGIADLTAQEIKHEDVEIKLPR
jgi:hypothetical protein